MHKPTLLKVLRILKDYKPEDGSVVQHVVAKAAAQDTSLDPQKLLAGAGISL